VNVESLVSEFKRIALELEKRFPSVDVAEHVGLILAINKLGLKPSEKQVQKGFDALNPKTDEKYEIKTRRRTKLKVETGQQVKITTVTKNQMKTLDYLVLVQLGYEYNVEAACLVPKDVLRRYIEERGIKEGVRGEIRLNCFPLREKLYSYPGVKSLKL